MSISHLKLYLLGVPRTVKDNKEVHIGRRKATALLAFLAMTHKSHSRDALATFFWPELNQSHAYANLRRVLSVLKQLLGESRLEVDRETVRLNQGSFWLDVTEFRQHLAVCKSHNHSESKVCEDCVQHLKEAVALYQDDFLQGFSLRDSPAFDEWQFFLTEELRREQTFALERIVYWHDNQANYEAAIPYARRWLALDPLHEPAHRCLMMLYLRTEKKSAALRQYKLCTQTLIEELGITPSEETTELYEHIRSGVEATSDQKLVSSWHELSLSDEHKPLHNLPAELNTFIGREKEIRDVQTILLSRNIRLLTLTGPGGTGKTRLGLTVAGQVINNFPDGVFFTALASLRDPTLVLDAIAQSLGLRDAGDMTLLEIITINLREKQLLLVLDNFEHVVQAAPKISALLSALPQLKVLVTSRTLLRLTGEHIYPVLPMSLPDAETVLYTQRLAQNEAVQLFVDRATAVKPGFTLTDKNAHLVVEICSRLEGLPLAIELAAARIRLLPLQGLLTQLEHRLNFLTGGTIDLPSRQHTLRSTIEWSYALLGVEEQVLFRRLAVFAGGCTLMAAETVCNAVGDVSIESEQYFDVLTSLEKLVDQSLLQQSEVQGTARFMMLETIREYASEKLSESNEAEWVQQVHAHFFLELAEESEEQLDGAEPALWLGRLERELDNLRAVFTWALAHDIDMSLRLSSALTRFWILQARLKEGRDWLAQALVKSDTSELRLNPLRARALRAACELAWHQGDSRTGIDLGEQSVAIFRSLGDRHGLAYALQTLGQTTLSFPDSTRTLPTLEESISLCREINDDLVLNKALLFYGWKLMNISEYIRAHTAAEECLHLAQAFGFLNNQAYALWLLGNITFRQPNYMAALPLFNQSLRLFQQVGNRTGERFSLEGFGFIAFRQGHYDEAKRYALGNLTMLSKVGNKASVAYGIHDLGYIALYQGHIAEAKTYFAESLALLREVDIHQFGIAGCLLGLAQVTDMENQPERIAIMLGAAEAFRSKTSFNPYNFQFEIDRIASKVHFHINDESFDAAYAEGLAMTKEEAIAFGLEEEAP